MEYSWQPFINCSLIEPELLDWLCLKSSVTAALEQQFLEPLEVQALYDNFGQTTLEESSALGTIPRQRCYIREVLLNMPGDPPCIYAKTVCLAAGGSEFIAKLRRLGSRPLGKLLFKEPELQRSRFEFARFTRGWFIKHGLNIINNVGPQDFYWGRRSLFSFGTVRLLLLEIFLKTP